MRELQLVQEWLDFFAHTEADRERLSWLVDQAIRDLSDRLKMSDAQQSLHFYLPTLTTYLTAREQLQNVNLDTILDTEVTEQHLTDDYAFTVGTLLVEGDHPYTPLEYLHEHLTAVGPIPKSVARGFLLNWYSEETTDAEMSKIAWDEDEPKIWDHNVMRQELFLALQSVMLKYVPNDQVNLVWDELCERVESGDFVHKASDYLAQIVVIMEDVVKGKIQ